jgi:hypothetical protein
MDSQQGEVLQFITEIITHNHKKNQVCYVTLHTDLSELDEFFGIMYIIENGHMLWNLE